MVVPGETGYLLPRDSLDDLAAALSELAGDAGQRTRLGEAGRAFCRDRFRHETMTEAIRDVYTQIVGAGWENSVIGNDCSRNLAQADWRTSAI